MADEKDVDDGFTVVSSKQKSKQHEWKIKVKQADPDIPSAESESKLHTVGDCSLEYGSRIDTNGDLLVDGWEPKPRDAELVLHALQDKPRIPSPMYHPDFAFIRSPSDVLFRTADGVLFWFSLSLLAHHSPRFALLDPMTLWLRRQPLDFSAVVTVIDIDSRSFAIIAHILLHDHGRVQKAIHLEEASVVEVPSDIVDSGVVNHLRQAIIFAKTFGIESFVSMATSFIAPHVDKLLLLQPYHEYDTGSQMKELLGM